MTHPRRIVQVFLTAKKIFKIDYSWNEYNTLIW